MPGRQAKLISSAVLRRMLRHVPQSSHDPARDRVMILLSVRAGLRAAEIAQLRWSMVLDARGRIGDTLVVTDQIAKKRRGRNIPVHPELRAALHALMSQTGERDGPVIRSARGGAMQPNSIVNWFVALFAVLQMEGCSSHSGRRTFIIWAIIPANVRLRA
jgi:integrase